MISKFFPYRLRFLLMLFSGLVSVCSLVAQTPQPPKKKYPVTVYLSSASGSNGVGLYSLTVSGKTTNALHPVSDEASDPYLILTVELEDGVATPVSISADNAEYIRAWIPCADAYITIDGNLASWTFRGSSDLDLYRSWWNNYDFSRNFPITITVRSVKPKTSGSGPQQPPSP